MNEIETKYRNPSYEDIVQAMVDRKSSNIAFVDLQVSNGDEVAEFSSGRITNVKSDKVEVSLPNMGSRWMNINYIDVIEFK